MRRIRSGLSVVLLSCLASGSAQSADCPDCDIRFSLSRDQVVCVGKRLDRLIGRPSEPVYFDAAFCSEAMATTSAAHTMSPANPDLSPPAPVAKDKADALWLRLSKRQLICLKRKIAALPADGQMFEFRLDASNCPVDR